MKTQTREKVIWLLQHLWFVGGRPLIYKGIPVGSLNKVSFMGAKMNAADALFYRSILCAMAPSAVISVLRSWIDNDNFSRATDFLSDMAFVLGALYLLFLMLLSMKQNCCCRYVSDREDVFHHQHDFLMKHPERRTLVSAVLPVNGFCFPYYKYVVYFRRPVNNTN